MVSSWVPFFLQNRVLSVLQTREVSLHKRGISNWVSHQQTYILFTSFTQGCHCGKVLDDSFCVDSLASAGFSARGRGKKTKTLLKQLQLILLKPVQPAPPLKAVLRLPGSGICSLLLSHFHGNTSNWLNEEVQSYDSSNRFFIQLSSEVLYKPMLHRASFRGMKFNYKHPD